MQFTAAQGYYPFAAEPEQELRYIQALSDIVETGQRMLEDGRSALDVVTEAVRLLEECPLFNAGIGAVYTRDETHELDACVMDGNTLNAGAVAGVSHLRNPILAARLVMEHSPHVMMIGEGAENFAIAQGMERVSADIFSTPERYAQLLAARTAGETVLDHSASPLDENNKMGTVGAVALDMFGNLAAATSTGGMTNKLPGGWVTVRWLAQAVMPIMQVWQSPAPEPEKSLFVLWRPMTLRR